MPQEQGAGGDVSRFFLSPAVPAERMLANMRSSIARGLPLATRCKPHGLTMSVAAGGPSLVDTYRELTGFICAVNGSLRWLLEREDRPEGSYACGIIDAGEHIADLIVADPDVRYYVASVCDPRVFEKLQGCDVKLWHITPESTEDPEGVTAILNGAYPEGWSAIGGGCTMGLRWLTLGYSLGFRKFELHGLDSSFRGESSHAYPDRADHKDWLEFNGHWTRPNFLAQVYDFFGSMKRLRDVDHEPIDVKVFGEGLLQDEWARYCEARPAELPVIACVKWGDKYGPEYVTRLRDGVARNLNRPHQFVCFTDQPVEGVKCLPLPADYQGWWAKIGLFKLKRPLIYFDLDVVITGDLSPLLDWQGFGILKDSWLPMFNSSVMVLTGGERKIYDVFNEEAMRSCEWGDQEFITKMMPDARTFPREWVPSYKADKCLDGPPAGALAINFHGDPKPADCGGWVAEVWKAEQQAKQLKPKENL